MENEQILPLKSRAETTQKNFLHYDANYMINDKAI